MVDPDDQTNFFEEVNADRETQDNARDLVEADDIADVVPMEDDGASHEMLAMVDALQILGVDAVDATRYVANIMHKHRYLCKFLQTHMFA